MKGKMVSKLRWISLAVSFVVFMVGLILTGFKVKGGIFIPTLVCPINQNGILESSCYLFAHLNRWINETFSFAVFLDLLKFFGIFFVFTMIFGRILCGFVCPFGFIQDILDKIRIALKINPIKFDEKAYGYTRIVKWLVAMIFFVGCFVGINCYTWCPSLVFGPNLAGTKFYVNHVSAIVAALVIFVAFFKRRFWCNICPVGLLIGLFHKISLFRLKKDCQACTECGACYQACPVGIKSIYTERDKTDITTHNCIMCTECIKKCPEDKAISISFVGKKFYTSSRFDFLKVHGINIKNSTEKYFKKLFHTTTKKDKAKKGYPKNEQKGISV